MPDLNAILRAGVVALLTMAALTLIASPVPAQRLQAQAPAAKPEMLENCPGLVAARPPALLPAAFTPTALNADQVRLSYVGHSTFLIESPRLVRIATDYNDYVKPLVLPDIVTMNHAHSTHYTDRPDPGIKYVLRGWAGDERPARHDINFQDVRVRNVPTNIRTWGGDSTERHGNSIFIYEIGNMCIAHLGHLHHTLTQAQLNEIGRIDIVMVPVDGTYTLDLEGMLEVVTAMKAQVVIPMHYFSAFTLNRFLERVREKFDVETSEVPSVVFSKATLPAKPKVLVLPGR
jgi:L-ascorbate metabolism protein UlaG (beta-lactamase superfamily)